jgi:hypothetical protein
MTGGMPDTKGAPVSVLQAGATAETAFTSSYE